MGSSGSVSSLLSVSAIAADKMISVAWPFIYGVSKKKITRAYSVFIWVSAAILGTLAITQSKRG